MTSLFFLLVAFSINCGQAFRSIVRSRTSFGVYDVINSRISHTRRLSVGVSIGLTRNKQSPSFILHSTTDDISPEKWREDQANSAINHSSPYFSIDSTSDGPNHGPVHRLTFHQLHPSQKRQSTPSEQPLIFETGRVARQAAGAVTVSRGDTVLLATTAYDATDTRGADLEFVQLSTEYQERFSSAGLTSGSYTKRDGKPAEHEVLTARLMDRPLRPLIETGWAHDTQVLCWVLSYDGSSSCEPLAMLAAAASIVLSDVPVTAVAAAVQVGMIVDSDKNTEFILNPTREQRNTSMLQLIVAGTSDAILMVEGSAEFVPESIFLQAIQFGHEAVQVVCQGLEAFSKVAGKPKKRDTLLTMPIGLQERVDKAFQPAIDVMFQQHGDKEAQRQAMTKLYEQLESMQGYSLGNSSAYYKVALKTLLSRRMFVNTQRTGKRGDGRAYDDIRRIDIIPHFLPRAHGSALFTRGQTQAMATTTLGDSGMRQRMDTLDGIAEKRFYLQYTFPPSSVGETGRIGAPGRREVGHGNLAERALIPTLPDKDAFPYVIRVESLITESHGSSSMASVCGGCLALMDAGVPIQNPVAGIAMGLLLSDCDDSAIILSDITGTEDSLGTMDFKVAGDRQGITAFQLDVKCEGLTINTVARALEQARVGRLHILEEMTKALPRARPELPMTVPKIGSFSIPFESIGKVIGPGGKQIRAIIDKFNLISMDVNDDGVIQCSSFDAGKLVDVKAFVSSLLRSGGGDTSRRTKYAGPEPIVGETYTGKITGIHPFGVFVEIMPGAKDGSSPGLDGLCHVSELAMDRVRNCEGYIRSLNVDELTVKYLGIANGKIQLSRKAAIQEKYVGYAT